MALSARQLPPWRTVYRWFGELRNSGGFERLNHHPVQMDRVRVGREPMPSAAVIDSQNVKTTEASGPRGYDAGKKVKGRKRHAMVDTGGWSLELLIHPADVQDGDGVVPPLKMSRGSAYASPRVAMATSIGVEIVLKFADQTGFVVHPPRGSSSELLPGSTTTAASPKGFEQTIRSATAFLYAASAMLLIRSFGSLRMRLETGT